MYSHVTATRVSGSRRLVCKCTKSHVKFPVITWLASRYYEKRVFRTRCVMHKQEAQPPQRDGASDTHVFLGSVTGSALHWTPYLLYNYIVDYVCQVSLIFIFAHSKVWKAKCCTLWQMAISQQRVVRSTSCLVLGWGFQGRRIQRRHFPVGSNSRWRPAAILENFKRPYLSDASSDRLRVCSRVGFSGTADPMAPFPAGPNSRWRPAAIWKTSSGHISQRVVRSTSFLVPASRLGFSGTADPRRHFWFDQIQDGGRRPF